MEFRLNIMLSAVIHAALITAVSGIVTKGGAAFRVPESTITVALLESIVKSAAPQTLARKNNTSTGARRETANKDRVLTRPRQMDTSKQKNPFPQQAGEKIETPGEPGVNSGPTVNKTGVVLQSPAQGGGNELHSNNPGPAGGKTSTGGDNPHGTGESGTGTSDVIGIIRAAIEKAKNYPPLAKKRGIEGTATTEFAINSKGHPENIRIVRSSGSDILDTAAKNTVLRASPFPFVKGRIEVPITFRIEKEQ